MWGGAELGREGLCRKRENDEEGNLVGMRRKQGKEKSRNAVGLAGREGLIHWKNAMLAPSSFHYVSQYIDKLMRQRK